MNRPSIFHIRKHCCFLVPVLLLAFVLPVSAQDAKVVRDLQLWTGASLEKTWSNTWTASLHEEIRFKHDISEINNYYTEASLGYRISKNFALEGGYRYTRDKKTNGSYENLTRYNLDLRYRGRLDAVTVDYRLRYQKEVEGFNLFNQKTDYEKYVRNRVRVRYEDLKKIKPYLSAELFQLFRPDHYAEMEYIRVVAGIKYEAGKSGDFDLGFGFNREFADFEPAMIYQIKLRYTYEL